MENADYSEIYKRALVLWKYMSIEQGHVWQEKQYKRRSSLRRKSLFAEVSGFGRFATEKLKKSRCPEKPQSWVITSNHTSILNRYRKSATICFRYAITELYFAIQEIAK